MMIIHRNREGQTLIETALVLFLLLLIVLGITEFARAWYTKNSLKNAARTGARVAVITPGITTTPTPTTYNLSDCSGTPTGNAKVFCSIWTSPGIKSESSASLTINDTNGNGAADIDETVTVTATMNFATVVPQILGKFIPNQFSADASMRYE
jgi:Flp pilus assembly protein TadG